MAFAIQATNLVKHYDGGHIKALDGVDVCIEQGDFVAIVGPSGSGKSTLLNMLAALDSPDQGEVLVNGENLRSYRDLASFRRDVIGFVFQLHNLIPTLTAVENVQIPLMETKLNSRERRSRALHLLDRVGMSHRAGSLPTRMSGGERQRVAIARALANNPRIIIADEPTGSVDSANAQRILELLEEICLQDGRTLILVTHDSGVAGKARRRIRFLDGKIIEDSAAMQRVEKS